MTIQRLTITSSLVFVLALFSSCSDKKEDAQQKVGENPQPGGSRAGSGSAQDVCAQSELPENVRHLAPLTVQPTVWVGSGTSASCTESALRTAF
jgi:hypothetical protein